MVSHDCKRYRHLALLLQTKHQPNCFLPMRTQVPWPHLTWFPCYILTMGKSLVLSSAPLLYFPGSYAHHWSGPRQSFHRHHTAPQHSHCQPSQSAAHWCPAVPGPLPSDGLAWSHPDSDAQTQMLTLQLGDLLGLGDHSPVCFVLGG